MKSRLRRHSEALRLRPNELPRAGLRSFDWRKAHAFESLHRNQCGSTKAKGRLGNSSTAQDGQLHHPNPSAQKPTAPSLTARLIRTDCLVFRMEFVNAQQVVPPPTSRHTDDEEDSAYSAEDSSVGGCDAG